MSSPENAPAHAAADVTVRLGTTISGRYLVQKLLGSGGMGAVYLAEHTHMKKRVALKLLHPEMSDNAEVQSRFEREAMAAARVDHPNVAAATDFGRTEDGAYFLVLEYVEGESLRDALVAPFPAARALRITRQIALALERAHDAGIVHRDLKPENVMLVKREDEPDFVKVLDFGIAKVLELGAEAAGLGKRAGPDPSTPLTKLGTILGTPEYMSPEAALGEAVTPAADLYGVGVMLFEMLTAKHPFDPPDRTAMLSFHIVAPVPTMEARAPEVSVPPIVEALVRKLLEKETKNRYASARALVEAIDEAAKVSGLDLGVAPAPQSSIVMAPPSEPRLRAAEPWAPRDAFAQTFVGTPAPELPTAMPASNARPSAVSTLRAQSKRTLLLVAAALPIGFLLIVVIVLGLRRGKGEMVTATGDAATPAARGAASKTASGDRVNAATALGAGSLEALAKEFPEDHALPPKVATAYAAENKNADALRVVDATLSTWPAETDAFLELTSQLAAKGKGTDDDTAFALLESKLGPGGIDAIIELSNEKSPALRNRANKVLTKPEVREHASPAALAYLDLKAAQGCNAKRDLMARVKKDGDGRVLSSLKSLQQRGGCGFLRRGDCWACLRRDTALEDAVTAVESRGK